MPLKTGLEAAKEIGNQAHVVFITAYDQYAIEAFDQGAVDYDALLAGQPQGQPAPDSGFQLFRIGDAVSARNTHAAIYDALRLVKDL